MLEWAAISSSRGSSRPRGPTRVAYLGRRLVYHWATGEPSWSSRGAEPSARPEVGAR